MQLKLLEHVTMNKGLEPLCTNCRVHLCLQDTSLKQYCFVLIVSSLLTHLISEPPPEVMVMTQCIVSASKVLENYTHLYLWQI